MKNFGKILRMKSISVAITFLMHRIVHDTVKH